MLEPKNEQVNYLIDEADYVGKGGNSTISMLHHFLEHHSEKEKDIFLQADNCVGQKIKITMLSNTWCGELQLGRALDVAYRSCWLVIRNSLLIASSDYSSVDTAILMCVPLMMSVVLFSHLLLQVEIKCN